MVSVPVASQTLHAVGYGMGARKDGRREATLVYFGDGATSEGDFHEACNFASVFSAGVIFLCQNNQWAISVPLSRQTTAPIFRKAEAYGFPGVRVDGNDVLAVYQATREAAGRRAVRVGLRRPSPAPRAPAGPDAARRLRGRGAAWLRSPWRAPSTRPCGGRSPRTNERWCWVRTSARWVGCSG